MRKKIIITLISFSIFFLLVNQVNAYAGECASGITDIPYNSTSWPNGMCKAGKAEKITGTWAPAGGSVQWYCLGSIDTTHDDDATCTGSRLAAPVSGTTETIKKPTASIINVSPTLVSGIGTIGSNSPAGTTIISAQWYKDTSGCGNEPRVHLPGCTGTLLGSSTPGSRSGDTWSTSYSFAGTVTKETKYSLKVKDSNNNWSSCVSSIVATTTGAEPISGFGTGVDTSTGTETFNCSSSSSSPEPNGTTRIKCPASKSGVSKVRNYWTYVGTSEDDCGGSASCEYYAPSIADSGSGTNNPENESESDSTDPAVPICETNSEREDAIIINSGESFTNVVTTKNVDNDNIKWVCAYFECDDSTCNYKQDYTTGSAPKTGNLSAGKIQSAMTYNNSDNSNRARVCTFVVTNNNGKEGRCTSRIAVRPETANSEDDDEEDSGVIVPAGGIVPANFCGSVVNSHLNRNASSNMIVGVYDWTATIPQFTADNMCAPNSELITTPIPAVPTAPKTWADWQCKNGDRIANCRVFRNGNAENQGESNVVDTSAGDTTPDNNPTIDTSTSNSDNNTSNTTNALLQSKSSQFCGTYAREWGVDEKWPTSWGDLNASGGLCKVENRNADTSKNVIYGVKDYPVNPPTSTNPAIWSCWTLGSGDLSTIVPCVATRKGNTTTDVARAKEDAQGECGTAIGYYNEKAREAGFTGRTFCNRGIPEFYNEDPVVSISNYNDTSQFPFPTEGRGRTKWTCLGTEKNSSLCEATIISHGDSVWKTVATTATEIAVAVAVLYGVPAVFGSEISAQIKAIMNAYGWANFAGSTANTLQTGNIDLNTASGIVNKGMNIYEIQ